MGGTGDTRRERDQNWGHIGLCAPGESGIQFALVRVPPPSQDETFPPSPHSPTCITSPVIPSLPPSAVICICLLHSAIDFPLVDLSVSIVGIFRSTDDADGGGQKTPFAPRSWGKPSSPAVNSQDPTPPRAKGHQGGGRGHCPQLHPLKWASKVRCLRSLPHAPADCQGRGRGKVQPVREGVGGTCCGKTSHFGFLVFLLNVHKQS